jgi:hypothetical protein
MSEYDALGRNVLRHVVEHYRSHPGTWRKESGLLYIAPESNVADVRQKLEGCDVPGCIDDMIRAYSLVFYGAEEMETVVAHAEKLLCLRHGYGVEADSVMRFNDDHCTGEAHAIRFIEAALDETETGDCIESPPTIPDVVETHVVAFAMAISRLCLKLMPA